MRDFLRAYVPDALGPIVNPEGRLLGEHRGLHLYTLGQRRGVGVASPVARRAYVVMAKRAATRELVLALEGTDTPGLYVRTCTVCNLVFPAEPLTDPGELLVRPRYRAPALPATIRPLDDKGETCEVTFAEPQRALTPGQIAAFYEGEQLAAGGIPASVGA